MHSHGSCSASNHYWEHTSQERRLLNFAEERFISLTKHAENEIDDCPDDLKNFFTDLDGKNGFEEFKAAFTQQEEGDIREEQLKLYLENEDPTSPAGDILWQLFEDIADPTKAVAADQKIQVVLSFLRDRHSSHHQAKEARDTQTRPEREECLFHYTNKLLETTGTKPAFKNLVEGFKNASGKEKAVLLAGIALITIMLLKNEKTKKILGWTLGIGAIALASDVAIRVVQRSRFPDEKSWRKAYSGEQVEQVHKILRDGDFNVPDSFVDRVAGEKKYVYPIINLSTLSSEEFEELYFAHKDDGSIPSSSGLYPFTKFTTEDEQNAGITDAQRFHVLHEMAEALGYFDGGDFEIPEEKYDQSILYQILDLSA